MKRYQTYIFSIAFVTIASAVQWVLWPVIGTLPFLMYYAAVLVSVMTGDGLLTIILSVIANRVIFTANGRSPLDTHEVLLANGAFITLSLTFYYFGTSRRNTIARLQKEREQATLRETQQRAILDSLTEGIIFVSRDGHIQAINKAGENSLFKLPPSYHDKALHDIPLLAANGSLLPLAERPASRALRGEVVRDFELGLRQTDGSVKWFLVSSQPVRNEIGEIIGAVSSFFDVTDRKAQEEIQLKAEKQSLRAARERQLALDAAKMGWWHYDPQTKIATYDKRYTEIFEVTGSQRPNEEILTRLHPDDLPNVWAAVERALDPENPQPYSSEYRIFLPDGRIRWIEAHGIASFEGIAANRRAVSLVGTVADITERKLAEDHLRRTLEFSQESLAARDNFLSVASYELGTPLTSLRLLTQMTLRKLDGQNNIPPNAFGHFARQTEVYVNRLVRLIEKMLDISRLPAESAPPQQGTTDLCQITKAVAQRVQASMASDRLKLEVDCPHAVLGIWDASRLEPVITNLINNAAPFANGAPIRLRVWQEGGLAHLSIADHGGSPGSQSQTGQGATFTLSLPLTPLSERGPTETLWPQRSSPTETVS